MPKTDHDTLIEIRTDVGYIKEKIEILFETQEEQRDDIEKINSWKDRANGALAILSVVTAVLCGVAAAKLGNIL